MRRSWLLVTVALLGGAPALHAQSPDSIVIRITSRTMREVPVSGTIRLGGGDSTLRYDRVMTPVKIVLPRQALEVRFSRVGGGALGGEITEYRGSHRAAHVTGEIRFGSVRLYREASGAVGFGRHLGWLSLSTTTSQPDYSVGVRDLIRMLDAKGQQPCVRTTPMPVDVRTSADSMPRRELDSTSVPRMPVVRLVPCKD